jgi:hypothetical protein
MSPWLALSVVCAVSLFACDDGEPPPLDSGVVTDAGDATADVVGKDTGTTSKDTGTPTSKDSGADHTVADARGSDARTDVERDASHDSAMDSAGRCGDAGVVCGANATCWQGQCTASGQAAGELCGADCPSGTTCATSGYCTSCGGPGEPCCAANECASGGCCVAGVCTPAGSVCPFSGGMLCESSSCGNACPDGGCSVCGGPGQKCCSGTDCTAPAVYCVTTGSGSGASSVCEACGGPGQPCCESACLGDASVCTTSSVCAECGGVGEPCCAGSACTTGTCTSGRCG